MRSLFLIPALLVVGCAGIPANQASNIDLCEYTIKGGQDARIADAEVHRRGLDCTPYYQAIWAKRRSQSQALGQAAQIFAPRPAPPPPIQCQSYRVGNSIATDCR